MTTTPESTPAVVSRRVVIREALTRAYPAAADRFSDQLDTAARRLDLDWDRISADEDPEHEAMLSIWMVLPGGGAAAFAAKQVIAAVR